MIDIQKEREAFEASMQRMRETWEQMVARAERAEAAQRVPQGKFELTKSIIHKCPAIRLPQSFVQRLGMTAQVVALKGADDALAAELVRRLNAAAPTATEPPCPTCGGSTYVIVGSGEAAGADQCPACIGGKPKGAPDAPQ